MTVKPARLLNPTSQLFRHTTLIILLWQANAFTADLCKKYSHRNVHLRTYYCATTKAGLCSPDKQNSVWFPMVSDMRVLSLIEELRSDNEIRQSEACSELAEMLLLGNEEVWILWNNIFILNFRVFRTSLFASWSSALLLCWTRITTLSWFVAFMMIKLCFFV